MGVHDNHRQRLKERYQKEGLEHFADHEVLELLLYFAIPQKDVNPLAHMLLERYGTLHGVFEAGVESLCENEGIGKHAATLLSIIPDLLRSYSVSQQEALVRLLKNPDEIAEYLRPRFFGRKKEVMFMVCIGANGEILFEDVMFEGTFNTVHMYVRDIVQATLNCGATNLVIAHNHPRGMALPSAEDLSVTENLYRSLSVLGIKLVDHFIFTALECVSLRRSGFMDRIVQDTNTEPTN